MKRSTRWILVVCAFLLVVAVGLGGFFLGKNTEAGYAREKEKLNILLNRSDLEGLDKIEGPIYITGHKSPDTDTVASAIAYADLLRQLGYDAKPAVLGKINHETEYVLKAAGLEPPAILEDASGLNMLLVDHSEYVQSADGLNTAQVVGIIDHHGDGSVTTGNQLIYDARPLGATATIIWIRYRNYGLEPDRQTAMMMMGAIMSDTNNLQSNATTLADREAYKDLCARAGVTDPDTFFQEMYKARLSYEGMTDDEIFHSDYKEYECGSMKFSIGCVNAPDEETAKQLAERMKTAMPASLTADGTAIAFAQISVRIGDTNVTYLVPSGDDAREVVEAAYGETGVFDGTAYRFEPSLSRKGNLVPAFQAVLESWPKE